MSRVYHGNPQKNSPALGATIAYLGINGLLALLHGSQGCSTFIRLQLNRHFKEPVPLNSTALLEDTAIFGGWEHLKEGIAKTADKYKPQVIGVMSSGLTETYGDDMASALSSLRQGRPDLEGLPVVLAATPDYIGSMQEGYQRAVLAMVSTLTDHFPEAERGAASQSKPAAGPDEFPKVAVFPGCHLTPGDIDELKGIISQFGLEPITLPDISVSLDGHAELEPAPVVQGGTPLSAFAQLKHCRAVLTFGTSMAKVGKVLNGKYGLPHYNLPSITGLKASDHLMRTLGKVAEQPIPAKLMRDRNRLLDALADYHDALAEKRIALALESDLLHSLATCLKEVGCEVTVGLAATAGDLDKDTYEVGDLEELEERAGNSQLLISNSNGRQCALALKIPHLRAGLPVFDYVGYPQKNWIGYRGTQQFLFDVLNTIG